jgi:hypothetical protein
MYVKPRIVSVKKLLYFRVIFYFTYVNFVCKFRPKMFHKITYFKISIRQDFGQKFRPYYSAKKMTVTCLYLGSKS